MLRIVAIVVILTITGVKPQRTYNGYSVYDQYTSPVASVTPEFQDRNLNRGGGRDFYPSMRVGQRNGYINRFGRYNPFPRGAVADVDGNNRLLLPYNNGLNRRVDVYNNDRINSLSLNSYQNPTRYGRYGGTFYDNGYGRSYSYI